MARIRTIKPEIWVSDQFVECSWNARLAFIGMWNFCDDSGRHAASAKRLKGEVFPCDNLSIENIETLVDELINVGLIDLHQTPQGIAYWQVTGWHHQRIDKPQPSKFEDGMCVIHRTFQEHSENVPAGMEWNGMDRNGKEGGSPVVEESTTEPAVLVFPTDGTIDHWELRQDRIDEWAGLYPGLDVLAECRKALAWIKANRRKTAGGMPKFLVSWLNKATDNGRRSTGQKPKPDLAEMDRRIDEKLASRRKRSEH